MSEDMEKKNLEKQMKQHEAGYWKALGFDRERRKEENELFEKMGEILSHLKKEEQPSKVITEQYKSIFEDCVGENNRKYFLHILDKQWKFSYPSGLYRRAARSVSDKNLSRYKLSGLFRSYYNLSFYGKNMVDYFHKTEERYKLESLFGRYRCPSLYEEDDLIAAELDMGDTGLAEVLEDILMSENNTNVVTTDIIRGIIKSDHTHLHKILGDFLLAARLQEGARQAVCENMDCGTPEAFLTLLKVIEENDLIRYSSVKRAAATWTGICDEENMERISVKLLSLITKALEDEQYRLELLKSNDSIELYIGLWAQGFYEVEDSMESCRDIILNGTRNQKLVVSYYNIALQKSRFTMAQSKLMFASYPQDIELCAAYMPTYMSDIQLLERNALYGSQGYSYGKGHVYAPVSCTECFDDEAEARKHFGLLRELYDSLPKKGKTFSPCIFPWYSVSIVPAGLVRCMAMIAYMLQDDELIDFVCPLIPELNVSVRYYYLGMLLHNPGTSVQKDALIQAMADKGPDVRKYAFKLISKLALEEKDYTDIRKLLKYKSGDIRQNVLGILEQQKDEGLYRTIGELVSDKKEELRLGGLDLIVRLKKDKARKQLFDKSCALLADMPDATDKEQVIICELTGDSQADSVLEEKGYGLYNPDAKMELPEFKGDSALLKKVFHRNTSGFYRILDKLEALIEENKNREYKCYGTEHLLGERYNRVTYDSEKELLDCYPFPELWRSFYEEQIRDYETLQNLYVFLSGYETLRWERVRNTRFAGLAEEIYGQGYSAVDMQKYPHGYIIFEIINTLYHTYSAKEENRTHNKAVAQAILWKFLSLPVEKTYIEIKKDSAGGVYREYAVNSKWFVTMIQPAKSWKTEEEFRERFILMQTVNKFYGQNVMEAVLMDYVKAYTMNMISLDNVYQAAFDVLGLNAAFTQVKPVVCYPEMKLDYLKNQFLKENETFEENAVFQTVLEVYWNIVEMILKVELKRSEVETKFSYVVGKIWKVRGAKHLVDILTALGRDTLDRSAYYSYYGNSRSKRTCLSHLLHVSEPLPGENGETLKKALKGKKITDRRLVEVAMFSPKWIDCIEEYLGWSGLKSGVYYFNAHMNERFDDKKTAIIARYTPLTTEELNNGAFDLNWFKECSTKLGEKHFQMLYDSAKYISDSNKHTRARKYADAAQGKVTAAELEETVSAKRNKDLLMSYSLVPIESEEDILHRYQYLQRFLKESRQFGAQRRASESLAVSMAMQNLAINTGYEDVTRLTLNMETKLVETLQAYFDWQKVEEVKLKIQIAEDGKPSVVCEKNGKSQKSVPAKLKKNEFVLEIKDVCKQLKDQYTRTKAMLEQFMEDGVELTMPELVNLQGNPVIWPLLKNLVYISGKGTGFIQGSTMTDYTGKKTRLTSKRKLRIAHPFDLWKAGNWHEYQKILFEREIRQPFKQVFRELYVKTEEELDRHNSLRYAGNQIQPKKTAACLRGRRWVADYEDGLQKVYYKENIVARIYALADWFSPSDIEAPTLEWVEFSDRKTFRPMKIQDVPDVIFSEVMRDVDLAVSVAHAGGVDPETSHSTMEMRRAIIEFNLPLFGLTNVTFSGNHAIVEGTRATYTIHLGSGVIFKRGGAQIAVLPVHSQHRGKLFLPFVDEDPKTAEIMSKVVLFAEDQKIKDPYILEQIMRG